MVQASEDRPTHQTPSLNGHGPIGWFGDLLDALMRASLVGLHHVFANHPLKMVFRTEDEVVQAFAFERSNEPLTHRVRHGDTVGNGKSLDAHHPVEPTIQYTSMIPTLLASSIPVLSKDAVIVVNEKARPGPEEGLSDLLFHPVQTR